MYNIHDSGMEGIPYLGGHLSWTLVTGQCHHRA